VQLLAAEAGMRKAMQPVFSISCFVTMAGKRIFHALIKLLHLPGLEPLSLHLHVAVLQKRRRDVFDGEPQSLGCGAEPPIHYAIWTLYSRKFRKIEFTRGGIVEALHIASSAHISGEKWMGSASYTLE
jgi:hypothetical protein